MPEGRDVFGAARASLSALMAQQTVRMSLRGQEVDIDNRPLCSVEQVLAAMEIVDREYPQFIAPLPEDHPWKWGKVVHAGHTVEAVQEIFGGDFGFCLENLALLLFVSGVHDIGRAAEAKGKENLPLDPELKGIKDHGESTVILLGKCVVLDLFPSEARCLLEWSIRAHSGIKSPELKAEATSLDRLMYFFACVVRDMDKLALFAGKTDIYLYDKPEKTRQIGLNDLEGEQGTINPPSHIAVFEAGEAIIRKECRSYESYMLQFLAWIFDVNVSRVMRAIVDSGAIRSLLRYFLDRLPAAEWARIQAKTRAYLGDHGIDIGDIWP